MKNDKLYAILKKIQEQYPAVKSMIEISLSQIKK